MGTPDDVSVAQSAPRLASVASCRSRNAVRSAARHGAAPLLAGPCLPCAGLRLAPCASPELVAAVLRALSCVADTPRVADTPEYRCRVSTSAAMHVLATLARPRLLQGCKLTKHASAEVKL